MKSLPFLLGICVRPIALHLPVCTTGPVPLLRVSLVHVLGVCMYTACTHMCGYLHALIQVCWVDVHVGTEYCGMPSL